MADIKQAAEWMKEGKRVIGANRVSPIRGSIDEDGYSEITIVVQPDKEFNCELDLNDLLAEDWEIAE